MIRLTTCIRNQITEMAFIYTMKPWSGNKAEVSQTNPMRSKVMSETMAHTKRAICMFWIIVTAKKTTAIPSSMFSMATDRM